MLYFLTFLAILVGALTIIGIIARIVLVMLSLQIDRASRRVLDYYALKTYKVPAFVEILRRSGVTDRAFPEIISLHEQTLGTEPQSVYEILESNKRLQSEFRLLMVLANALPGTPLESEGSFVALRDHIIAVEREIKAQSVRVNRLIARYERWRLRKNITLMGVLLPARELALLPM